MENQQTPNVNEVKEETSIFSEEDFSVDIYDKHIRQARNAIFVAAGIILLSAIILMFNLPEGYEYLWFDLLFYGAFIGGFIALGFWTKKKPYSAITFALILYGIFIGINAYIDIKTLFSGIILKIIIISLLVKGLSDGKQAQEMQQIKK
jgi:peptidoglycan/LPS O-acetylase OafA/YrhL